MPPVVGLIVAAIAATPIIGAIGIGGAVLIGQAVLAIGLGAALSYAQTALARMLTDRPGSGAVSVNAPEVRGSVRQATPPQRVVFGEVRCGGAVYFYDSKPPFLTVGLMHSTLPVSAYVDLYIGQNRVPLDSSGNPLGPPYLRAGAQRLTVSAQLGALDQPVNPLIAADYPALGAAFRVPGVANTVARYHYGADIDEFQALWGNAQIPDLQWVTRGTPVYDPRDPTNFLPAAIDLTTPAGTAAYYAAASTWKWSNNAALIQAFWAMMPFGLNAGPSRIDWDEVAEAANFDDEPVALKAGGYQKRHTIDGVVLLNQPPSTVLEAMLTANRGFVVQRAGRVYVSSSQPRAAEVTITAEHMVGGFEFRNAKPKRDLVNIATCAFIAPDRDYQDAIGPVLRREELIAADGEELEQNVRLPFTSTHQRSQRLLKSYVLAARLGKTLASLVDLRLLGLREGQAANVWNRFFPRINGLYSLEDWSLDIEQASLAVRLSEYDPAIDIAWNPEIDEQDFSLAVNEL